MREIVSFSKEIEFKTMVHTITGISLEHTLALVEENMIQGDFIVSGTYKMTGASQIEENFNYKIPVDISIDDKYDTTNLSMDIYDFAYTIVNEEVLRLTIDLSLNSLELKICEESADENSNFSDFADALSSLEDTSDELEHVWRKEDKIIDVENTEKDFDEEITVIDEDRVETEETSIPEEDRLDIEEVIEEEHSIMKGIENTNQTEDLFKEVEEYIDVSVPENIEEVQAKKEMQVKKEVMVEEKMEVMKEEKIDIGMNENITTDSIFMSFSGTAETYSTYRVYIVREGDNVEEILNKYKITREELEEYNNLSNITKGSKLIIPSKNE